MKYKISLLLVLISFVILFYGCGDDSSVSPVLTPTSLPTPTPQEGTSKLTVNVIPADAQATVRVEMAEALSAQAEGEYVIYLAPGTYEVIVSAVGYNTLRRSVTMTEGQDIVETADLTGEEIPIEPSAGYGVLPKVCINTGDVPFTLYVENFTGTGTVELLSGTTVLATDTAEPVSGGVACEFTIDNTFAAGEYTLRLTHNPPVVETSSTSEDIVFYVEGTIQGAIDKANEVYTAAGGTDQVMAYIPAGTYKAGDGAVGTDIPFEFKSGVWLKGAGNGGEEVTPAGTYSMIDGEDNYYAEGAIFSLVDVSNVSIDSFRLTGGNSDYGGAVYGNGLGGDITVKNSTLLENHSSERGGSIYFGSYYDACNLFITDNIIRDNYSDDEGGGLQVETLAYNSSYTITGNKFMSNFVTGSPNGSGGGLYCNFLYEGGVGTISENTFTGNGAMGYGGAIRIYQDEPAVINITDNIVTGNYAGNGGGGFQIYREDPDFVVPATISNNTISGNGGELQNVNLGGTLYTFGPVNYGGGIYMESGSYNYSMLDNIITENNAGFGGGIYFSGLHPARDISGNTITGNNATDTGGGLYFSSPLFTPPQPYGIKNNTITGNTNNDSFGSPVGNDGMQLYNADTSNVLQAQNNTWDVPAGSLTNADVLQVEEPGANVVVE